MELCLVLHPEGAGHLERQRSAGHKRRRQAGVLGGVGLPADFLDAIRVFDVGVGGAPFELAVDPEVAGGGSHAVDRVLLGPCVEPRLLGTEPFSDVGVDHRVLCGELGGGVAGDAGGDPVGLQQRHGATGADQLPGGADPGDAGTDHDHVDLEVLGQRGIGRAGGGGHPV
jgi:hypothetical protein